MNEKLQSLVEKSGMVTHLKTVECLKKNGWSVVISPYYYDGTADIVKEIDIIAEKSVDSSEVRYQSSGQVNAQLFIECKYLNQEIVTWFDLVNRVKAIENLQRETGLKIAERRSGDILPEAFHYLRQPKVAKLFSTNINKEDPIYKGISQCLRALVYYKQWSPGPLVNAFMPHREATTRVIRYPVVVCDNFSNLKEFSAGTTTKDYSVGDIKDSFLLETNYVYFNKAKTVTIDEHYLIDFIDANRLETHLCLIEEEVKQICKSLSFLQR